MFLVLLCSMASIPRTAHAQSADSTTQEQVENTPARVWHVDIAPYLWFSGVHGTVGAGSYQSSVHVSAGDVLSNLDIGIMGAVEARYSRLVIPVDFLWVKLTDDRGTPLGLIAQSVKATLNEDIFTPKVGYRLVESPKIKVDALGGLRYWHLGATLTLQPTSLNKSTYGSSDWVDALGGARFQALLTRKTVLTISGDAGGGGASLDYQIVGLLGYKVKRVTLQGGWRYLTIHRNPTGPTFADISMTGVLIGVVIPIK
jgi:hypothetical protein